MDVKVGLWWKLSTKELMFWTVVLEKTLESPLNCKEIQPVHSEGDQYGCSLEGLMLKLKLQSFGHLMWRVNSLEKTLMLGGIGGRRKRVDRGWDGWLASLTWRTWIWVNSRSWWWTGRPGVLQFMGSQRVGHDWETELNWTEALEILKKNSSMIVGKGSIKKTKKQKNKKQTTHTQKKRCWHFPKAEAWKWFNSNTD